METPSLPYESETTAAIAAALVACQGALRPALKDSNNPAFKTRYADLASVMDAIREPMLVNGLAIQHQQLPGDPGRLVLRTVLRHKSGEFLASVAVVPLSKQDAQGMGSALTYARRYGVAAMLGVVQDDDDGNAASAPQAQARQQEPAARRPEPEPSGWAPNDGQVKRAYAIGKAQGLTSAEVDKVANKYHGVTGPARLPSKEAYDAFTEDGGLLCKAGDTKKDYLAKKAAQAPAAHDDGPVYEEI